MASQETTPSSLDGLLDDLVYNEAGLIPAIAQQYDSGEVLMMAWMSPASLKITLEEGQVCYWSRSRQKLWRKGESSGHVQRLVELRYDCDSDCLLLQVDQTGPACHTDRRSCYYKAWRAGRVGILSDPLAPKSITR